MCRVKQSEENMSLMGTSSAANHVSVLIDLAEYVEHTKAQLRTHTLTLVSRVKRRPGWGDHLSVYRSLPLVSD